MDTTHTPTLPSQTTAGEPLAGRTGTPAPSAPRDIADVLAAAFGTIECIAGPGSYRVVHPIAC